MIEFYLTRSFARYPYLWGIAGIVMTVVAIYLALQA